MVTVGVYVDLLQGQNEGMIFIDELLAKKKNAFNTVATAAQEAVAERAVAGKED